MRGNSRNGIRQAQGTGIMSKIGHMLTVSHWNAPARRYDTFQYVIIGERRNRFGQISDYYIPVWDAERGNFRSYSATSYFIQRISDNAMPMSEQHKAMARAIRFGKMAALCDRVYRHYAIPHYASNSTLMSDTVNGFAWTQHNSQREGIVTGAYHDVHEGMAARAKKKRGDYEALRFQELRFAGVI